MSSSPSDAYPTHTKLQRNETLSEISTAVPGTEVLPKTRDPYYQGHIMPQADAERLTGRRIHPEIFSIEPTGNLIHVILEQEPEEYGHIILPNIGNNENMGVGYIIAAGPVAGDPGYTTVGPGAIGVIAGHPSDLLGLHVIFASHVGSPLRVSMLDREFRAAVLIMSSRDIRAVDQNLESLTERAKRRAKE